MNHPIPYNIYLGWKRPLESILGHFLTHICEKGPKKLIFRNFLPGELIFQTELGPPLIVQTTQIIPLFIAPCMYFEGKVTKICRKSPKFLKIPSNRANREPLPEKGPFLAVFGPFFQFWFNFSQKYDILGPLSYVFLKLHYNRLHMAQKASHLEHLLASYGFLWHDVPNK